MQVNQLMQIFQQFRPIFNIPKIINLPLSLFPMCGRRITSTIFWGITGISIIQPIRMGLEEILRQRTPIFFIMIFSGFTKCF